MTPPTAQLTKVRVQGFRSLEDVTLELTPITVVIGPNGAGKSNLLTALRLPPLMRTHGLRRFVGEQGGASKLLHYGAETTRELSIALEFKDGPDRKCYEARLGYAAGDSFVFLAENLFLGSLVDREPQGLQLGTGHSESLLRNIRLPSAASLASVPALIGRMSFFHFHDTSPTSPLRQNATQADSKYVRSNGSNLAAYLYRIKGSESEDARAAWRVLEGLVRRVAPFIHALEPDRSTSHGRGARSAIDIAGRSIHAPARSSTHASLDATTAAGSRTSSGSATLTSSTIHRGSIARMRPAASPLLDTGRSRNQVTLAGRAAARHVAIAASAWAVAATAR